jgi:uncharacterized repeat protein (TIGR01451 family)
MYKLRHLFIALLCTQALPLVAQFGPEKIITACNFCGPKKVVSADLNGDGAVDILASSQIDNKIVWYKNDGQGNFSGQIPIAIQAKGVSYIYTIDLDKDGDLDILSPSIWEDKIFYYQNEGKARFTSSVILAVRTGIYTPIVAGDLDGDQDLDLVSFSGTGISWNRNEGNNRFSQTIAISFGYSGGLHLSDLDKDGDLDIAASIPSSYSASLLYNDGKGNFPKSILIENITSYADQIFVADLGLDGDNDILTSAFELVHNLGNDLFGYESFDYSINDERELTTACFVDINKDKHIDMVGGFSSSTLGVYINNGLAKFSKHKIYEHTAQKTSSIDYADFDGDGDIDLCAAFFNGDKIAWFEQKDSITHFEEHIIEESLNDGVNALVISDYDRDGDMDIVSAASYWQHSKVMQFNNDGSGNFTSPVTLFNQKMGTIPSFVKGFSRYNMLLKNDLEKDGDDDYYLASIGPHINNAKVLINRGDGTLSADLNFSAYYADHYGSIDVADLNGDHYEDVIFNNQSGIIRWFPYLPQLNKFDMQFVALDRSIDFAKAVDLDNDGDQDLVGALASSDMIWWYINNGKGEFTPGRPLFALEEVNAIHCADLDGDKDQDLLIAGTGTLVSFENTRNGFSGPLLISNKASHTYSANSLNTADIDGDGDLDVLTALWTENSISWYENNGNGVVWVEHKITDRALGASAVQAADIDGDGDLDVVSASKDDDKIAWYENRFNHPTISGMAFWDENGNGVFDANEQIIKNLPISLTPDASSTFTGEDGKFRFYVPNGSYQLRVRPNSCWLLTTDSLTYTININGNVALNRDFGFKLISQNSLIQPHLSSTITRCSFEVPFVLSVENRGCAPNKGWFGLIQSPLAQYLGSAPDQVRGDTLLWRYDRLLAGELFHKRLNFRIIGVNHIGDTIRMKTLAYIENSKGQRQLANTFTYVSEIRCAYDPNDKASTPNRRNAYTRNYTLFNEETEYSIRFQNLGNDTAFTIVIRDTLDNNLLRSTFKPIAASHPFETQIEENGAVAFTFKNILLPPAKINEPLSHGFINYRVLPRRGLPEQTEILNTAYIYFDFNPPIQTNTTSNVLVSSLPRVTSTHALTTEFLHRFYPNPFRQQLWFELGMPPKGQGYTLFLYNAQAQLVHRQLIASKMTELNTVQWTKGLYWYLLKDSQGRMLASGKIIAQ